MIHAEYPVNALKPLNGDPPCVVTPQPQPQPPLQKQHVEEVEAKKSQDDEGGGVVKEGIQYLFSASEDHFSISLRPLLLEEIPGNAKTGCLVMTTRVGNTNTNTNNSNENDNNSSKNDEDINIRDRIRRSWRLGCNGLSVSGKEQLLHDVEYLISCQTDDTLEILQACKKYSAASNSSPLAGTDEAVWLFPSKSPLRKYAFLRRLIMPMHHIHRDGGAKTTITQLDVSLLNLLLDLPFLKETLSFLVNRRLAEIKLELDMGGDQITHKRLEQLCRMIWAALKRAGCPSRNHISSKAVVNGETYAIPERIRKDPGIRLVRGECERLLRALEERKKNVGAEICHYTLGGKIKIPYRIRNGTLLVTEDQLSYEEFVRQKGIMEIVNKKLKRPFHPGTSRPKMHKANLSVEAVSQLRSIFFDERGRLRKSIVNDIDKTTRHGYITFSNSRCEAVRNDYRWQVPLRRHGEHQFIATRSMVESLLSKHGFVHPEHERIHDMGILIGGTEDQSLHHDIPRQTTSWLPQDPATSSEEADFSAAAVGGWEYDRAAYNEAMASPHAPCSVLIGLGRGKINVGVQKNLIDRTGCTEGWCRIVDGKENEEYQIIRENRHLVVLEVAPGALFTGDFQHAGVRNFPEGSPEDKIMMKFFDRVESIIENAQEEEGEDDADITMEMISMMGSFENLDKICRFHCSTEPIRGPLRVPRNAIGFVDCQPNPPTDRVVGNRHLKRANQLVSTSSSNTRRKVVEGNIPPPVQTTTAGSLVKFLPAHFTTLCPQCHAVVAYENEASLDEVLSQHMYACENSRTRSKRPPSPRFLS